MEPRHPGALSSLRLRRRNPPVSSLHLGSCWRLALPRPRRSGGGRAGGPSHGARVATVGTRSQRSIRGGGFPDADRISDEGGALVDRPWAPLSCATTARVLENDAIAPCVWR